MGRRLWIHSVLHRFAWALEHVLQACRFLATELVRFRTGLDRPVFGPCADQGNRPAQTPAPKYTCARVPKLPANPLNATGDHIRVAHPPISLQWNPRSTARTFVALYGGRTASTPSQLDGPGQVSRVRVSALGAGVVRVPERSGSASAEPSKRQRTTAAACCRCATGPGRTQPLGFPHVRFAHRACAALCGGGTASTPSQDPGRHIRHHLRPLRSQLPQAGALQTLARSGHRSSSHQSRDCGLSPRGFAHLNLRACCRTALSRVFMVLPLPGIREGSAGGSAASAPAVEAGAACGSGPCQCLPHALSCWVRPSWSVGDSGTRVRLAGNRAVGFFGVDRPRAVPRGQPGAGDRLLGYE